ncbi:MAG: hypothetical protein Q4Q03_00685 [Bowdeniella nasicola]|nr:hypothetical protein [Bowdeniella nasicola]
MADPTILTTLTTLVWPLSCAGCGAWDTALCDSCHAQLYQPLRRIDHYQATTAGLVPIWSVDTTEIGRRVIGSYLRAIRTDIGPQLCASLAHAADEWWARMCADIPEHVPVVHLMSLGRRRGERLGTRRQLVSAIHDGLCTAGADTCRRIAPGILTTARRRFTQASAALMLGDQPAPQAVVLVDDELGDGRRLVAHIRAVQRAGLTVIGALVFAAGVGMSPGE